MSDFKTKKDIVDDKFDSIYKGLRELVFIELSKNPNDIELPAIITGALFHTLLISIYSVRKSMDACNMEIELGRYNLVLEEFLDHLIKEIRG